MRLEITIEECETAQEWLTCLHEATIRIVLRAAKLDLNMFEESFDASFSETGDNCGGDKV